MALTQTEQLEREWLLKLVRGRYGLSSTNLILSAIEGDPVQRHPYDEGDVQGLTKTLESLPAELRERAQPIYEEQMRRYRAAQECWAEHERAEEAHWARHQAQSV